MKRYTLQIVGALTLAHFAVGCAKETDQKPVVAQKSTKNADDEEAARRKAEEEARARALAARAAELDSQFDFEPIKFGYDSTDLDADARATLDKAAKFLADKKELRLTISGHADERGTAEYNLALGENRAKTVKKYLGQLGIDNQRLGTITFGELQPIDSGSDESAFAKNRRAELKPN
jgi:peptidoglycan-associated lipoprotein